MKNLHSFTPFHGVYFFLFSFLLGIGLKAQVSDYTFSQHSRAYLEIPLTSSAVFSETAYNWNDPSPVNISLGFTFKFNGQDYTSCSVNPNGYITFGNTSSQAGAYIPISTTRQYQGAVSGLGINLRSNGSTNSIIRYKTLGTTPNRVLIVQWKNSRFGDQTGNLNFQIRLYETSNIVEVAYGSFAEITNTYNAEVGLRGSTNSDFNNRQTTNNWSATTAGTANNHTVSISNTVYPQTGLVYRWTPPVLFHNTGSITVPCGVKAMKVETWGAGGGGGYSSDNGQSTGGGGGGGYATKTFDVNPGMTFFYGVGTGGLGSSGSNDGGNTWFNNENFQPNSNSTYAVMASGGKGVDNNNTLGAVGGTGVYYTTQYAGGNGGNGSGRGGTHASGGGGGAARFSASGGNGGNGQPGFIWGGTGGSGGISTFPGGSGGKGVDDGGDGQNGFNYGGGGGGGKRSWGGGDHRNGGNGANGVVRITYTYEDEISPVQNVTSSEGSELSCDVSSTILTASGGNVSGGVSTLWYEGNECPSIPFVEEFNPLTYSLRNAEVQSQSNGNVRLLAGEDAGIHMENVLSGIAIDPAVHRYIVFRYKVITGVGGQAEIYFKKEGTPDLSESAVERTDLINDEKWHIASVDMSQNSSWNDADGGITGWRFDFSTNTGTEMDIDYIVLSSLPILENTNEIDSEITVTPNFSDTNFGVFRISEKLNSCGFFRNMTTSCTQIPISRLDKTYQGSGDWDNGENWLPIGVPESHHCVTIPNGREVTVSSINAVAGRVRIANGGKITINSGAALNVMNEIINDGAASDFIVENNGSIVQINDAVNTGNITVRRHSTPMIRLDATYWSSPVAGQKVKDFSPGTVNNRFYIYNGYNFGEHGVSNRFKSIFVYTTDFPMPQPIPTDWAPSEQITTNTNNQELFSLSEYTFQPGWGYSIRTPNVWPNSQPYEGAFVGVPHNGPIEVPAYGRYTLVGNPYPSSINIDEFFNANSGVENIQLWTHHYKFLENENLYNTSNYVTVTLAGPSESPDGYNYLDEGKLAVGQGFVVMDETRPVVDTAQWDVVFNNSMRNSIGGTFVKMQEEEKHRFWLSLYQQETKISEILLAYMTGATNEYDHQYDGKRMGESILHSIMDSTKLAVQARALPFEASDVVPIGVETFAADKYSFRIEMSDGLFDEGQDIYIYDKLKDVYHNLITDGIYEFELEEGDFNDRFEIVYQTEDEEVMDNHEFAENNLMIYQTKENIVIDSGQEKILSVELYDLNGRSVHRNETVNANIYYIPKTSVAKHILVVKVLTADGHIISKKIINR